MEESLGLRPIPSEDFFFFLENAMIFGTKIGAFSRLRSANSNNFEKWPTRVQKLDHPASRDHYILRTKIKKTGHFQSEGFIVFFRDHYFLGSKINKSEIDSKFYFEYYNCGSFAIAKFKLASNKKMASYLWSKPKRRD